MPTRHHRRAGACTGCGDVVLIAEDTLGTMFGLRVGKKTTVRLEHADPGPNGELFDAVDDGCQRSRIG